MDKLLLFFFIFLSLVLGQDCILTGPSLMLSANGLATPWTNNNNQSIIDFAAFVQGAIYDPSTSQIYAYNPLVITAGTSPAIVPTVPNINNNLVIVGLWFGYNGFGTLILADNNNGTDLALGKFCFR
jgi:hypothetical protein